GRGPHPAGRDSLRRERIWRADAAHPRKRNPHLGRRGVGASAAGADTMRILIDVGNTRIKLGWIKTETGEREAAPLAVEHAEAGRIAAWLDAMTDGPVSAL